MDNDHPFNLAQTHAGVQGVEGELARAVLRLAQALTFYADAENYRSHKDAHGRRARPVMVHKFAEARAALHAVGALPDVSGDAAQASLMLARQRAHTALHPASCWCDRGAGKVAPCEECGQIVCAECRTTHACVSY
jgi:hypothetical protein